MRYGGTLVAVGGADSYSWLVQVEIALQTRSLVAVGAADSYC